MQARDGYVIACLCAPLWWQVRLVNAVPAQGFVALTFPSGFTFDLAPLGVPQAQVELQVAAAAAGSARATGGSVAVTALPVTVDAFGSSWHTRHNQTEGEWYRR